MEFVKSIENVLRKSALLLLVMAVPVFSVAQHKTPSAPAPRPSAPAPRPSAPAARPTAPVQKPAAPAPKPSAPAKPSAPVQRQTPKPSAPTVKPSVPQHQPTNTQKQDQRSGQKQDRKQGQKQDSKSGQRQDQKSEQKQNQRQEQKQNQRQDQKSEQKQNQKQDQNKDQKAEQQRHDQKQQPARKDAVQNVKLKNGDAHMVGGKIRSANVNGMHIDHNLHGGRTTMTEHNHVRVVTNGRGGYVQRPFRTIHGRNYYSRTYYEHGVYRTAVYREYLYGGHYYYGYYPGYVFQPAYYGWAYQPWGVNVYWGPAAWGWVGAPWYAYYGFAPYPYYGAPAFWLTDYMIAANLQAAYAAAAAAPSAGINVIANEPWTDTGMQLVEGQTYAITASGVINYSGGNPATVSTPAGGPGSPTFDGRMVAPNLPAYSLIGKIGPAGVPFYVGNAKTFVAPVSGEFYLGYNDSYFPDNSGVYVANVNTVGGDSQQQPTDAGPAPQGSDPVVLSDDVKQAIAAEVKAEIDAERAAAAQGNSAAASQEVPAALDPAHRTFMVVSDLAVVADGQECSLTQGDVITRLTEKVDADQKVSVSVASSKKQDCAVGATVAVSVDDLQEMHNHMAEQLNEGMKVLASKQGTNGMPKGPDGSTVAGNVQAPAPDKSVAGTLQAQQSDADRNESQIQQEAGGSAGGSY